MLGDSNCPTFNFWFSGGEWHPHDKNVRRTDIGAFRFTKIDASVSSIPIPYDNVAIETGPIKVTRAEPSQLGYVPFSIINFDTGVIQVNWPVSASFELLERANLPPIATIFTGVGKMNLETGETFFFDVTEFEIPSFTTPDGTMLPAKKCKGGNLNVTIIVAPTPPLPPIPALPSTGSFRSLTPELLARGRVDRMARQAFSLSGIRVTENFVEELLREYRRTPERELQFYFPDDDFFVSSQLQGDFELEFIEKPEVFRRG